MPAPVLFDSNFKARRRGPRGLLARALPHRQSYLGFTLGLLATVVVCCAGLCFWLVESGIVDVRIDL